MKTWKEIKDRVMSPERQEQARQAADAALSALRVYDPATFQVLFGGVDVSAVDISYAFFDVRARGASVNTLWRRTRYGGRKARAARRRLFDT